MSQSLPNGNSTKNWMRTHGTPWSELCNVLQPFHLTRRRPVELEPHTLRCIWLFHLIIPNRTSPSSSAVAIRSVDVVTLDLTLSVRILNNGVQKELLNIETWNLLLAERIFLMDNIFGLKEGEECNATSVQQPLRVGLPFPTAGSLYILFTF